MGLAASASGGSAAAVGTGWGSNSSGTGDNLGDSCCSCCTLGGGVDGACDAAAVEVA